MMNIIISTRKTLGLSQAAFGSWVAKEIGREDAFPSQRVSEWERCTRRPRKNVRDVCLPIVAQKIVDDAIESIKDGVQLDTVRGELKARIITHTR